MVKDPKQVLSQSIHVRRNHAQPNYFPSQHPSIPKKKVVDEALAAKKKCIAEMKTHAQALGKLDPIILKFLDLIELRHLSLL